MVRVIEDGEQSPSGALCPFQQEFSDYSHRLGAPQRSLGGCPASPIGLRRGPIQPDVRPPQVAVSMAVNGAGAVVHVAALPGGELFRHPPPCACETDDAAIIAIAAKIIALIELPPACATAGDRRPSGRASMPREFPHAH